MKALLVFVGLVLAAAAGAVGGAVFSPAAPARTVEPLQPQTQTAAVPGISKEAQQRLDAMSMEISDLQTQIAALRQQASRAPAVVAAPELEKATPASDDFADVHRAAILKVIDDQKAEEARKREEERKQREIAQAKQHADRVAAKVPLSEGQKVLLAQFYQDDRAKMDEMRTQMRDNMDAGGTPARDAFRDMREWHTNELTRLFGTELGAQIDEADNGNRRFGPNGNGQNGQNGGNGGGQRRRGGNAAVGATSGTFTESTPTPPGGG
jgi:hypothetical protein